MKPDFLWGTATSSHQIDGGNTHSDWWQWEAQGNIEGGVVSGRATGHWQLRRQDLELAASLGTNTYRFSIEWSRLEPQEGQWDLDALRWYGDLIEDCERLGLLPMATLHHFTLPQWLAERGGLTAPDFVGRFLRYVDKIADTLGPKIPLWCTFNEPMVLTVGAYLGGYMPPAIYSPSQASLACHHLLQAHVRAYDRLKAITAVGKWKDRGTRVGFAHNMLDFGPLRPGHPLEWAMAKVISRFYNYSWLDAVTGRAQHFGILGVLPYARTVREARGRVTADFIGINYYTKLLAGLGARPERLKTKGPPLDVQFARAGEAASDLGWAIHPQGLGKVLRSVRKYRLPIIITENGIADAEDRHRADYLVSHLTQIAEAIGGGMEIEGYYHWSLLDNFEWIKGFAPQFGLIQVDYETLKREVRPSGHLYRSVIEAHAGRMPQGEVLAQFSKEIPK